MFYDFVAGEDLWSGDNDVDAPIAGDTTITHLYLFSFKFIKIYGV